MYPFYVATSLVNESGTWVIAQAVKKDNTADCEIVITEWQVSQEVAAQYAVQSNILGFQGPESEYMRPAAYALPSGKIKLEVYCINY